MKRNPGSARKPPFPSGDHGEIERWLSRVMPDLHPIVESLDGQIRRISPEIQYALKWKRPFYGLPDLGWIVEIAAYDVSVNVVFFGGVDFESPPPLGDTGRSRYVKVRTVAEAKSAEMAAWLAQATRVEGWK